jgi:uncharacterized membrane protein YphA (DoxX/SURF4 family)
MEQSNAKSKLNGWRIATWIFQVVTAVLFLAAGAAKLAGVEQMAQVFSNVGIGQWFRYVTGLLEMGGAILLAIPATIRLGAALLACISIGAILTHLFVIGGSAVPALALLILVGLTVWLHGKR